MNFFFFDFVVVIFSDNIRDRYKIILFYKYKVINIFLVKVGLIFKFYKKIKK